MPKHKMPKIEEFNKYYLAKKRIYDPKKEPVWVYLEKEMQKNINNKPYNESVGKWLKFLKDLKRYYYLQGKKEDRILLKEVGPVWYIEMSGMQKEVLRNLMKDIHHDLLEDLPRRTRKSLSDLGIIRKISTSMLMKAMVEAGGDSAVFIWKLYTAIYKKEPSEAQGEYDMDARILMSALVFIDLDECIEKLKELTKASDETGAPKKKKKEKKYHEPKCQYGMYLQKMNIPVYDKEWVTQEDKLKVRPPNMKRNITIRSDDSYERIRLDHSFLEKRLQRSKKAQQVERVCTYKFWEPPIYLRAGNPEMAEYCKKLKMLQKKAKASHVTDVANIQYHVGPVCLLGGKPRYLLNNVCILPTGYIPVHGGIGVLQTGECMTVISGAWKFPTEKDLKCDKTCDCLQKWEKPILEYLHQSKCKCGHLYDYYHDGMCAEKYFYPPTEHSEMWFDYAKIYQLDPTEDFIKDTVKSAVMSEDAPPDITQPAISTSGVSTKALLESFLADLSDSLLVIPHLPQACLLQNLREWVRKRFKGKLTAAERKNLMLKSLRRWLWLKHKDFKARAYRIPFTKEETDNMSWQYRQNIQFLFETLLRDFTTRNQLKQLDMTRLWWSTMHFDKFPSQAFRDIYFTYMPSRMKDIHILNPFSAERTPNDIFKTCPLS